MYRPPLVAIAALIVSLSVVSTVQAEKLILPISMEGIERDDHRGSATEPRTAKTPAELKEMLGEEAASKLEGRIDFETHTFILFQWAGSGGDKISAVVEDETAIFHYKRGLTKDLRQHRIAFAVKKGTEWKVKTLPFGRG